MRNAIHGGVKCVLNSIRLSTLKSNAAHTHSRQLHEYQHPLAGVHKIQNYSCLTTFPPPARSRNYTPSPLRGAFSRKKWRKRRWTESSLRAGRLTAGVPFLRHAAAAAARHHGERERLKIIVNTCSKRRVTDICCVERSRWSRVACEPSAKRRAGIYIYMYMYINAFSLHQSRIRQRTL